MSRRAARLLLCLALSACSWIPHASGASEMLVATGSVWRYNDTGTDLGTNWKTNGYNDASWSNAPAPLSFGEFLATTNLMKGWPTYYFRKTFVLTNLASVTGGLFQVQADDGVVVYLNTQEVGRALLPAGTISYSTIASNANILETNWFQFTSSPSMFVQGTNIVAVEVHNFGTNSADMRMELQLSVERAPGVVTTHVGHVVINEFMYHPYEYWPTNQVDPVSSDSEYVELFNDSTSSVDLTTYRFDEGIHFDFTPGTTMGPLSYLVVAGKLTDFTNQYRTVTNVVGNSSDPLSSSGEKVTLFQYVGGIWIPVDSAHYMDGGAADGTGRSLELVHPGFSRFTKQAGKDWMPSLASSGTPGTVNSVYSPLPPPMVGGVDHSPAIPPPGATVKITADAWSAMTDSLASVVLNYRPDGLPTNAWQHRAMVDDGTSGDGVAHDGEYAIYVPQYGSTPYSAGTLLEFTITATDKFGNSRTCPDFSSTSVTSTPLSYLCWFGDDTYSDCAYAGEYDTYHILMTGYATNYLNTRAGTNLSSAAYSDEPVDGTVISPSGEIAYNCGLRFRGGSSRTIQNYPSKPYRVDLPRDVTMAGYRELNFNHDHALQQYFGMRIFEEAKKGCQGLNVKLVRLWVDNEVVSTQANHTIDVLLQGFDNAMLKDHGFDDPMGNLYRSDGDDYKGDLRLQPTLDDYKGPTTTNTSDPAYPFDGRGYMVETNDPYTCWIALSNLCGQLNSSPSLLPTILTNRVNVRQWARFYAACICLNNDEAGMTSPFFTNLGDELRLYEDKGSGQFYLIPWDMSDVVTNDTGHQWGPWSWAHFPTTNYLFNPPMGNYYAGDCVDLMNGLLSSNGIVALVDEMGSKGAIVRTNFIARGAINRTNMLSQINTNLTIYVAGTLYTGLPVTVGSSTVMLNGAVPQDYTDHMKVNSSMTPTWNFLNATWSQSSVTLTNTYNEILVEVVDVWSNVTHRELAKVIYSPTTITTGGTIGASLTWTNNTAGRVYSVTSNVVIPTGVTLTLPSNTVVKFSSGGRLSLTGGTLSILGTATKPVTFYGETASTPWVIDVGTNSRLSATNWVTVGGRISVSNGATAYLESSRLTDCYDSQGIVRTADSADFYFVSGIIENYGKIVVSNGSFRTLKSLFRMMRDAGVECSAAGSLQLTSSTLAHSQDGYTVDGVRGLAGTGVTAAPFWITNSLIADVSGCGVKVEGTGTWGQVRYSAIYDCATGICSTATTMLTNFNNTIAFCDVGISGLLTVRDSILWDNIVPVSNQVVDTVSFCNIELPMSAIQAGTSNYNRDPWFRSVDDDDFSLLPVSPFLTAASDGGRVGVRYPAGAGPAQPSNLAVSNVTASSVSLSWLDGSSDESWFEIQRSMDQKDWTTIGYASADATTYSDTTVSQGEIYYYRVRAGHNRGDSLFTDVATTTTPKMQTVQDLIDGLRITELMYHPPSTENREFIELQNVGPIQLNLSGLYMDGARYVFPTNTLLATNAFYLIVRNTNAFSAAYPGVSYQGVLATNFDNGGESIWIRDAATNTIIEFDYDDNSPWPVSADGGGYSLVLVDPTNGAPYDASRWRASTLSGGSPGSNDPPSIYSGVVINEVLAHQDIDNPGDWIELRNTSTGSINIGYWYLSDNENTLTNYRIPSNTVITAGGYVVFNEFSNFGSNALGSRGFAISEWGETLYLSSGDSSGAITSYRNIADLGDTLRDTTLGRYVNSVGDIDYVRTTTPTMGATNSTPKVGPIVINEIMYNPGPSGKEYVELYNTSNSTVYLFNGTNSWSFNGAMEYQFPQSSSIPSHSYALVSSVDPVEFRDTYGVTSTAIQVFGPFSGSLDNGGASVKLYEPGDPETNGFVPQILVERVKYNDHAPWPPAADDAGASLERRNPLAFGNDPTNWVAASLGGSPGVANNSNGYASVGFRDASSSGGESNYTRSLELDLYPAVTTTVTVTYTVGGSATPGGDFVLTNGTVTFWPYETNHSLTLQILDDSTVETDETVDVQLTQVSTNVILGGTVRHVHTIEDADALVLPVPSITPNGTVGFTNSQQITISTTSSIPGLTIYYTTDGTLPTLDSALYTNTITLTKSARITARHFLGSLNAGSSTSALYLAQTPGPTNSPFWLGIVTNGGGTVSGGNLLVPTGSNVSLVATPAAYYTFGGWAGDVSGFSTSSASVSVTITNNRTIIANFPLSLASNGAPQAWLAQYYGTTNFDVLAMSDSDGDGLLAWEEYRAGTVPTNPVSVLEVTQMGSSNVFTLQWRSVTGRVYSIFRSTNVSASWPSSPVVSNLTGVAGGTNVYSDTPSNSRSFYKVRVDLP